MVSIHRRGIRPVGLALPTISFSVSPSTVKKGGEGVMTWQTQDATSVTISPNVGAVAPSGTQIVKPTADTQYTISATGPGGTQSGSLMVLVRDVASRTVPPAIQFSVSPSAVFAGGTVHLAWHVRGAVTVNISPNLGLVAPVGTFSERISAPTTYTLLATGLGGIDTRQHLVTIRSP